MKIAGDSVVQEGPVHREEGGGLPDEAEDDVRGLGDSLRRHHAADHVARVLAQQDPDEQLPRRCRALVLVLRLTGDLATDLMIFIRQKS